MFEVCLSIEFLVCLSLGLSEICIHDMNLTFRTIWLVSIIRSIWGVYMYGDTAVWCVFVIGNELLICEEEIIRKSVSSIYNLNQTLKCLNKWPGNAHTCVHFLFLTNTSRFPCMRGLNPALESDLVLSNDVCWHQSYACLQVNLKT